MSDTPFEVTVVKSVEPHPHADRLEVVKVLSTQFVSQLGSFKSRDLCVYFPPDMLLPERWAEALGVANYLKHSVFPGGLEKSKCRIGAIRLRGVASFGFGISLRGVEAAAAKESVARYFVHGWWNVAGNGDDVTEYFGGVKYQPPECFSGDSMRQPAAFHTYTSIQHYYRNASAFVAGTPVRITEKVHGSNSRIGLIVDNGWEWCCGTHHRRVAEEFKGRSSLYWAPLTKNMRDMLAFISRTIDDVIVFGEIYGNKIQLMDYGQPRGKGYKVFDISVNGVYLDWEDVCTYCELFDIETVPLLYTGPFSPELIDEYASGPTILAEPDQIKCSFKGREGIVITPLKEQHSDVIGGRLILKAVSADYYEKVK